MRGLFGAGPDVWFCCFCLGTLCDSEQADCPDKKLTCRNLNAWETKSQIGNSHEMLPCRYQYHHFMYMCAHRPGLTTSKLCMIAWHALAWTARRQSFATIMKHSRLEIDGSSRLLQHGRRLPVQMARQRSGEMWKHFGGAFICVPQTFLLDICLHVLYSDHCTKKEVMLNAGMFWLRT